MKRKQDQNKRVKEKHFCFDPVFIFSNIFNIVTIFMMGVIV